MGYEPSSFCHHQPFASDCHEPANALKEIMDTIAPANNPVISFLFLIATAPFNFLNLNEAWNEFPHLHIKQHKIN